MTTANRWIDRFLNRVRFGQFLQRAAEWLAGYLFVFGSAVLLVKLFLPSFWPQVLWLAAAAVPVLLVAWFFSRRNPYTRTESVALLDRRLSLGGLLMTLSETPDEQWTERLPQVEEVWREGLPRLRPVRFARFLALPFVFAIAACFVPLRPAETAPVLRNTVGRQASQELEELLQSLDEEAVLDEQEKQQLRQEIEQLAKEVQDTPLTHEKWETVDALQQRLVMRLDESLAGTSKASQAAATLAKAMSGEGQELTLEQLEQLQSDIAETLRKLNQNGGLNNLTSKMSPELREQIQRLIKEGKLRQSDQDPQELKKMLDDLQDFLDQESERLSKLRGECKSGMCRNGEFCDRDGEGNCNKPGRGGVNRGRGDAELSWGDEADENGVKFKESVLPPGFLDKPKEEVIGITKAEPTVDPAPSAPRGAAQNADPASGSETWNRSLRPRHRSVVRKYFDTK